MVGVVFDLLFRHRHFSGAVFLLHPLLVHGGIQAAADQRLLSFLRSACAGRAAAHRRPVATHAVLPHSQPVLPQLRVATGLGQSQSGVVRRRFSRLLHGDDHRRRQAEPDTGRGWIAAGARIADLHGLRSDRAPEPARLEHAADASAVRGDVARIGCGGGVFLRPGRGDAPSQTAPVHAVVRGRSGSHAGVSAGNDGSMAASARNSPLCS